MLNTTPQHHNATESTRAVQRGDPVEVYYERIVAEAAAGSAHADSTGGAEGSAMTPAFAASAMLAQEMRRVEAEIPLAALDSERYALPAPAEGASLAEWQAAVDNAKAQAEHQAVRRVNLELLHTFGEVGGWVLFVCCFALLFAFFLLLICFCFVFVHVAIIVFLLDVLLRA